MGNPSVVFSVFPSANPALSLKHGDLLVELLRVSSFHDSLYTNRLCFFASKKTTETMAIMGLGFDTFAESPVCVFWPKDTVIFVNQYIFMTTSMVISPTKKSSQMMPEVASGNSNIYNLHKAIDGLWSPGFPNRINLQDGMYWEWKLLQWTCPDIELQSLGLPKMGVSPRIWNGVAPFHICFFQNHPHIPRAAVEFGLFHRLSLKCSSLWSGKKEQRGTSPANLVMFSYVVPWWGGWYGMMVMFSRKNKTRGSYQALFVFAPISIGTPYHLDLGHALAVSFCGSAWIAIEDQPSGWRWSKIKRVGVGWGRCHCASGWRTEGPGESSIQVLRKSRSDLSPGSTGQESSALAVLITTKLGGIYILVPGLTLAW